MKAYNIPLEGQTTQEHFDHVTSMEIIWDDPDNKVIIADGSGYVEVNGVILGAVEVSVREVV